MKTILLHYSSLTHWLCQHTLSVASCSVVYMALSGAYVAPSMPLMACTMCCEQLYCVSFGIRVARAGRCQDVFWI